MERYSSFEKLKERANASSDNKGISVTPEKTIINFIDLLRVSVVPANRSATDSKANSKVNFTENGR